LRLDFHLKLSLTIAESLTMGCCGPSKSVVYAKDLVEKTLERFPGVPVSGPDEKRGLGACNESFSEIKSFKWTLGGSGTINIKKVENVSMSKNVPKECVFEEVTGLFDCGYATQKEGLGIHIKKANVLHFYRVNCTKVIIDECNVCIIHDCNTDAEFTIKKGEIICVHAGDIILNKTADTTFKHWDGVDQLLQGQAAVDKFKEVRNRKPAVLNDI